MPSASKEKFILGCFCIFAILLLSPGKEWFKYTFWTNLNFLRPSISVFFVANTLFKDVPLENILLRLRRHWSIAGCKSIPIYGTNGLEKGGVFIVPQLSDTGSRYLRYHPNYNPTLSAFYKKIIWRNKYKRKWTRGIEHIL